MNVLGLADFSGSHDASAAIVCDGRLVAAAEEERFTRRKHQGGLALQAIDYCLSAAHLAWADIDAIAFADLPYRTGPNSSHAGTDSHTLRRIYDAGEIRYRSLIHKRWLDACLALKIPFTFDAGMNPVATAALATLHEKYGDLPPVRFYDHHRCHAAAAFLTSPFDESAIVTADKRGGNYSTVIWRGRGTKITRIAAEPFTNSLGAFYNACTQYAGLGEFGDGKMMGLAAYGDRERLRGLIEQLIETSRGEFYTCLSPPNERVAGFPPALGGERAVQAPWPDFAAAAQGALESAMLRIARTAVSEARSRNLCLGGGVALNCSANGALFAAGVADAYGLYPACGDAGISAGSALLCSADGGTLQRDSAVSAYGGPEFDDRECERALGAAKSLRYSRPTNLAAEASQALAEGKIIGWFQGRMEMGPRALGNRSILADPRTKLTRDRVNRIKGRESWRPLAPVVLGERAGEYFTGIPPTPFMLFAVGVRAEKQAQVAGVVHVDGSARPQVLRRQQNARLYDLVSAFEQRTGVPMLLNTSFNLAGEPIVCTPDDAIRTFLASDLDVLVLGNFLASRAAGNTEVVRSRSASTNPT